MSDSERFNVVSIDDDGITIARGQGDGVESDEPFVVIHPSRWQVFLYYITGGWLRKDEDD